MKKYLQNAPLFSVLLGAAAALLRLQILSASLDHKGLAPENTLLWAAFWAVCLGGAVFFWLLGRNTEKQRSYKEDFPQSILRCIGLLAGFAGLFLVSLPLLAESNRLSLVTGILGLAAGLGLAFSAWLHHSGKRMPFWGFAAACVFFGLRLFSTGRLLGTEPEVGRLLPEFFAILALMLSSYHLWGLSTEGGNRRKSLFWCLTAATLCLAAIPGNGQWYTYLDWALWMLTCLCDTQPKLSAEVTEGEEQMP